MASRWALGSSERHTDAKKEGRKIMPKASHSKDKRGQVHQKTITSDSGRYATHYRTHSNGFAAEKTREVVNKSNGQTRRK